MKALIYILPFLFFFLACDKIDDPIQRVEPSPSGSARKVLLEDYTGHQCGNCPRAADVADKLSLKYPGQVIVLAVHAGGFSKTNNSYPVSYTVDAGVEWNNFFGIETAGYPNGMVNRKTYPGLSGPVHDDRKWNTTVSLALSSEDPLVVDLKLTTKYDPGARSLNIQVKANFKTAYPRDIKLVTVLAEDSIIGPQFNYAASPSKVPDYIFNHMLREAIRGPWGDVLKAAPVAKNDSAAIEYPNHPVNAKFNDKQLTLIAFAYDVETNEVLQAEKVKIR